MEIHPFITEQRAPGGLADYPAGFGPSWRGDNARADESNSGAAEHIQADPEPTAR